MCSTVLAIAEIDDLMQLYERRVPRMFCNHIERGSWTEPTFRENTSDFEELRLRQRVAVDMNGRSTATQMIGEDVAMPWRRSAPWTCSMPMARSNQPRPPKSSEFRGHYT